MSVSTAVVMPGSGACSGAGSPRRHARSASSWRCASFSSASATVASAAQKSRCSSLAESRAWLGKRGY